MVIIKREDGVFDGSKIEFGVVFDGILERFVVDGEFILIGG